MKWDIESDWVLTFTLLDVKNIAESTEVALDVSRILCNVHPNKHIFYHSLSSVSFYHLLSCSWYIQTKQKIVQHFNVLSIQTGKAKMRVDVGGEITSVISNLNDQENSKVRTAIFTKTKNGINTVSGRSTSL